MKLLQHTTPKPAGPGLGEISAWTTRLRELHQRLQSWTVYRCLHSRSCTLYAGMTMTLTTARLEGLAELLLTRLAPL